MARMRPTEQGDDAHERDLARAIATGTSRGHGAEHHTGTAPARPRSRTGRAGRAATSPSAPADPGVRSAVSAVTASTVTSLDDAAHHRDPHGRRVLHAHRLRDVRARPGPDARDRASGEPSSGRDVGRTESRRGLPPVRALGAPDLDAELGVGIADPLHAHQVGGRVRRRLRTRSGRSRRRASGTSVTSGVGVAGPIRARTPGAPSSTRATAGISKRRRAHNFTSRTGSLLGSGVLLRLRLPHSLAGRRRRQPQPTCSRTVNSRLRGPDP